MKKSVAIALAACLLAPGQAFAEVGVTDTEIVIGSCFSREGEKAKFAKDMSQAGLEGASTYFDYINEQGGINGRKIKYITHDDFGDPEKSVECFNKLMGDGMFAFGANLGGAIPTGKYLRLAESNKVPTFGLHANLDEIYDPIKKYVFGAGLPWSKSITYSVDKLWVDAGKRRFAFIYTNDIFGNTNLDYLQAALKKHGSELVEVQSFLKNDPTNLTEQIDKIKAANPDVVFLGGSPPSGMAALKTAKEKGLKATFIHTTGARGFDYPKGAGDASEGYIFPANAPNALESKSPTGQLFLDRLKKSYPGSQPEVMRLALFVDMLIMCEALKRAGKDLTRDKFIAAMESLKDFDTGLGPEYKVTMNATDHQAFDYAPFFIIRKGAPVALKDWKTVK